MNILLLDDNSHRITVFQNALRKHKLTVCRHARAAICVLKVMSFDIIFLDHDLRDAPVNPDDENSGSEVARFIAGHEIECRCIVLHTENRIGQESMASILPQSQSVPYGKLKKVGLQAIIKRVTDLE